MAAGLEASFGGGYTALQRLAVLQLAWDHVSSALDGRESAFELHASGGIANWRSWMRRSFKDYDELANAVLCALDLPMPQIDLRNIPAAPPGMRRTIATPEPTDKPKRSALHSRNCRSMLLDFIPVVRSVALFDAMGSGDFRHLALPCVTIMRMPSPPATHGRTIHWGQNVRGEFDRAY